MESGRVDAIQVDFASSVYRVYPRMEFHRLQTSSHLLLCAT